MGLKNEDLQTLFPGPFKSLADNFISMLDTLSYPKLKSYRIITPEIARGRLEALAVYIGNVTFPGKNNVTRLDAQEVTNLAAAIEKLSMRLHSLQTTFKEAPGQDVIDIPAEIEKAQAEIKSKIETFNQALAALPVNEKK